jgi:hypothetical protein
MTEELIKAARTAMRNQMAQAQGASELEKEGLALAEKMMEQALKKDASISEDMGKEVLGFISKAASVKKRGANPKPDPTPALSGPSAGKGNTQTAAQKAALDVLTGKTSTSSTVVKKVLAPGNIEGIRQANKDGFQLTEKEINQKFDDAAKQLEINANDPAVKEKFRQLGIDSATFTGLTGNLQSGLSGLAANNIGAQVVTAQKKMASNQMDQLSNPFGSFKSKIDVPSLNVKAGDPLAPGSDLISKMQSKTGFSPESLAAKNPFGSMGVDFGNIQGSIASLAKGGPVNKDLGLNLPSINSDASIAASGLSPDKIPDIINKGGFTNLAETVKKSETLPDNIQPSTPVEEIGVPSNRPVEEAVYTTAHTSEEIELELGATKRDIGIFIVRWNATTSDNRVESAKKYNEASLEKNGKSANTHYLILRDGSVHRILNTEASPEIPPMAGANTATAKFIESMNKVYQGAIVICFDAGYTCTTAEKNVKFLSNQSITSEQMDSYRMIAEAAVRSHPGAGHIAMELLADIISKELGFTYGGGTSKLGPGFNADKYRENLMAGADTNEYVQERK